MHFKFSIASNVIIVNSISTTSTVYSLGWNTCTTACWATMYQWCTEVAPTCALMLRYWPMAFNTLATPALPARVGHARLATKGVPFNKCTDPHSGPVFFCFFFLQKISWDLDMSASYCMLVYHPLLDCLVWGLSNFSYWINNSIFKCTMSYFPRYSTLYWSHEIKDMAN